VRKHRDSRLIGRLRIGDHRKCRFVSCRVQTTWIVYGGEQILARDDKNISTIPRRVQDTRDVSTRAYGAERESKVCRCHSLLLIMFVQSCETCCRTMRPYNLWLGTSSLGDSHEVTKSIVRSRCGSKHRELRVRKREKERNLLQRVAHAMKSAVR